MRRLLSLTLLVMGISPLWAAKQALLIANADYSHFGKLPNPVSDARQLADVLREIGFNVNLVENASREGMLDALDSFEERLKASKGIAFFHYGGHGVQVDGKNFLIPADADIPDEKRVATRAVDVDEVMGALDASGSSANVVVLDACRDNPLPATSMRSATRGLSVVAQKPKNSIIIYAAEAGNKAQDGLFTPTLAKALAVPGRPISEVMTDVRREVYEKSGGVQTPGEYNQLFEQISLADQASASVAGAPPLPTSTAAAYPVTAVAAVSTPQGVGEQDPDSDTHNELAAAYNGRVGKLPATFVLEWDSSSRQVRGYYFHPSRNAQKKYKLEGDNPENGVLNLKEFSPDAAGNERLTANCTLRKRVSDNRIIWEGTMNNTDGRELPMSFSRGK